MAEVDELLMPWSVDLVLRHELPAELEAHLQRVGRCIWRGSSTPSVLGLKCRLDAGALYPEPEQQERE